MNKSFSLSFIGQNTIIWNIDISKFHNSEIECTQSESLVAVRVVHTLTLSLNDKSAKFLLFCQEYYAF